MLFPTLSFALFFAIVFVVHRALPAAARNGWLLTVSLFFYFLWLPPYLLLLVAVIGINYGLLRGMCTSGRPRRWLVASIVFTIGLLAVFKYVGFLIDVASPFSRLLAGTEIPRLDLLLPLGISFYSFQIVALHVDVYRRHIEPPPSLARYALFICFFPQLIAGPILRGSEFLPQLESGGKLSEERSRAGLWLLSTGLLKKVVMGDLLLAPMVDSVYGTPGVASGPMHLVATYAFAFQIYFDFSGYTDMARGIASLLGFHLPLNFEEPYLSRNPSEFWRRWHMTLSRWLRDYLYIPLGGNRRGSVRTGANLLLTMLLGGLWHGAGWTFVLWGGLHGLLLAAHRPLRKRASPDTPLGWRDAWRVVACFNAVCLLWVFFRSSTVADAMTVLHAIVLGRWNVDMPVWPATIVAFAAALHLLERVGRPRFGRLLSSLEGVGGAAVEGLVFGATLALVIACNGGGAEFIYFQF